MFVKSNPVTTIIANQVQFYRLTYFKAVSIFKDTNDMIFLAFCIRNDLLFISFKKTALFKTINEKKYESWTTFELHVADV